MNNPATIQHNAPEALQPTRELRWRLVSSAAFREERKGFTSPIMTEPHLQYFRPGAVACAPTARKGFFKTLKVEEVNLQEYTALDEAPSKVLALS
ncbi:hypothetical protein D3875_00430 [Deinococcus cavernae]|uniref:Uncharacterized protein n=1 Tax=Deinococcus cavernae TaxID=2320857 RepID=A0A418VIL3_9DEIO|nr:hypothetical protein D3875_00430 [Deinococcus cavernae]